MGCELLQGHSRARLTNERLSQGVRGPLVADVSTKGSDKRWVPQHHKLQELSLSQSSAYTLWCPAGGVVWGRPTFAGSNHLKEASNCSPGHTHMLETEAWKLQVLPKVSAGHTQAV